MKEIKNEYGFFKDLFDTLEAHLGKDAELVLHNLSCDENDLEHTIVDIRNGNITNRKIGDCGDDDGLQAVRGMLERPNTYNEFMHTETGRLLRCSSMYIHNSAHQAIGSICINQDISRAVAAELFLRDHNMCYAPSNVPQSVDINSVLNDFIRDAMIFVGKPIDEMKREDKVKFVQFLNGKGAFQITKAGTKICNMLNISKYTLYNYLRMEE